MTNCQDSGETDKDKEAKNKDTLKSFLLFIQTSDSSPTFIFKSFHYGSINL